MNLDQYMPYLPLAIAFLVGAFVQKHFDLIDLITGFFQPKPAAEITPAHVEALTTAAQSLAASAEKLAPK